MGTGGEVMDAVEGVHGSAGGVGGGDLRSGSTQRFRLRPSPLFTWLPPASEEVLGVLASR